MLGNPAPAQGGLFSTCTRRSAFHAAQAQWPALNIDFQQFCAHLDRIGCARDVPAHHASVYLCLACGQGDETACELLEAQHFPALRAYLARFDRRADVLDELLQQIRCRLFLGPSPRILTYQGRGSIDSWLRRVATTIAADSLRSRSSEQRGLRNFAQEPTGRERLHSTPSLQLEDQIFNQRHGRALHSALREAIQLLPNDARKLLYHYYVSGLSIDQLGSLYACDRSTAARRILRSVMMIKNRLHHLLGEELAEFTPAELRGWAPILYRSSGIDVARWLVA